MTDHPSAAIRHPRLSDIDELVELWTALVDSQQLYGATLVASGNEGVARQYFGRLLLENGVRVATIGDEFVGFVSFQLEPDQFDRTQQIGIVENLFVRSQHRGQGIGTALLEEAEQGLRGRGADVIELEVLAANVTAQGFYESHGYQPQRLRYAKDVGTDKDNAIEEE